MVLNRSVLSPTGDFKMAQAVMARGMNPVVVDEGQTSVFARNHLGLS
jgi:hypothetical protein